MWERIHCPKSVYYSTSESSNRIFEGTFFEDQLGWCFIIYVSQIHFSIMIIHPKMSSLWLLGQELSYLDCLCSFTTWTSALHLTSILQHSTVPARVSAAESGHSTHRAACSAHNFQWKHWVMWGSEWCKTPERLWKQSREVQEVVGKDKNNTNNAFTQNVIYLKL